MKTVAAGVLGLGLLVGCGGAPACPEPTFGGGTTDEALRALLDAEGRVQAGSSLAASLSSPTAGGVLSGQTPPTLRWSSPLAGWVPPASGPASAPPSAPRPLWARAWEAVVQAVLPAAHAHGTPLTGDAYLVHVQVPGQRCPLERFTTELEWTLTGEEWAQVRAGAPHEVVLTLTSAEFRDDDVTAGPYRPAAPVSIRVEE